MLKYLKMFWTFFKIGAFTFGGGYAMIPLIEEEVVNKNSWISKEEFLDILVVSQSFPGALSVNCSTFIGYRLGNLPGALLALLGTILPSFFIILCIVTFFMQFRNNYYVDLVFKGINGAVPVLVLVAVISLSKSIKKNYINYTIIALTVVLLKFLKIHPVLIVLISGIYGYTFFRKKVE
ncbi:chromate transporter [Clostridium sp. Marseille-Q2269]|uniref:chromate transporter n=1 Tax=Clostridium sp. Marseille-Q2269 TaxID=2942205 RepID=UPI0020731E74|nr:chromate transporter [Clostridium sp. Marseille-Q2269]